MNNKKLSKENIYSIIRAIISAIVLLLFLLVNVFLIIIASTYLSIDFRIYALQLLQLQALVFLIFFVFRRNIYWPILLGLPLLFLFFVIEFYYLETLTLINYTFLVRNIGDFFNIANQEPGLLAVILSFLIVMILAQIVAIKGISRIVNRKIYIIVPVSVFLIITPFFLAERQNNHLFYFAKDIFFRDKVIEDYQKNYQGSIQRSIENKKLFVAKPIPGVRHLENIIFLQLESVNQKLVSERVTPNLLKLARTGFYFNNFYANSTQTIFAQENILCGLLNSFSLNLVQTGQDKDTLCLPYVFESLGYQSVFAKTYDLGFTQTGEFMNNIGFSRVLSEEIMQTGDPVYQWGYREDVFYKRFFEYYQSKKADKNFIYLEVGPTNHWPFALPSDLDPSIVKNLPYPEAQNFTQRISNTTYIQDHYLGLALNEIDNMFPQGNYTLFVFSDHAWPIEEHSYNNFNQKLSYQENFSIPMVIKFGSRTESLATGSKEISTAFSSIDIMPSLLEMLGQGNIKNLTGQSFYPLIATSSEAIIDNPLVLIQPYSDQYINVLDKQYKYQYNSESETLIKFDLSADPMEKNPQIVSQDLEAIMELMNGFY